MPTPNEQDVFDRMQQCSSKIKKIKDDVPNGIIFSYNGHEYILKEEPPRGVTVKIAVPPNFRSGVFTKEVPTDKDWNFNFDDFENSEGKHGCVTLVPKNGKELEEYLDALAEASKP